MKESRVNMFVNFANIICFLLVIVSLAGIIRWNDFNTRKMADICDKAGVEYSLRTNAFGIVHFNN